MRLLFVPVTGVAGDQVQKERQYAACKAHTTRNAHRRRRQEHRKGGSSSCGYPTRASRPNFVARPSEICGNLDPFDCQAIRGSPLLDEAVSFVRFYHHASWSPTNMTPVRNDASDKCRVLGVSGSVRPTTPDRLWDVFVASPGTFCSVVASIVPVLRTTIWARDAMALENLGLQLKAKSLCCLRQTLQCAPPNFVPSLGLMYHVKALFREAAMGGDLQSAETHAKILIWLAEKFALEGKSAMNLLRVALWGDAIPALLQLRRPVLNHQQWMPQLLAIIWLSAESTLPDSAHLDEHLPGCIRSQPLRQAFLHARRALDIQDACKDHRLEWTEQIFQWMITKAEHHISNLLNLYFDLKGSKPSISLTEGEQHTEAAVALALLYLYQKSFSHISTADGVDMHESAGIVLPALTVQARSALARCAISERLQYREAHFWVLFVGSCCEERAPLCAASLGWFHQQLARQALELNLKSWGDAQCVLDRFFPVGGLAIGPAGWY